MRFAISRALLPRDLSSRREKQEKRERENAYLCLSDAEILRRFLRRSILLFFLRRKRLFCLFVGSLLCLFVVFLMRTEMCGLVLLSFFLRPYVWTLVVWKKREIFWANVLCFVGKCGATEENIKKGL